MYRLLFFVLLLFAVLPIKAQQQRHRLVVCDIETKVPMRNAIVATADGYRDTSNYRGVCYVPDQFDTLVVYKAKYLPEVLLRKELKDTTYLIPEGKTIDEVTVWGKTTTKDKVDMWKRNTPLPNPANGMISYGFDFANMIDKRGRRDRKHLRITREKFQEMDNSGDPIERAYLEAMEEQRRKKEQEEKQQEEQQKKGQQPAPQQPAPATQQPAPTK